MFGHNVEQPSSWLYVSRTLRWPIKTFVYPWRRLMTTSINWPSLVDKASWFKMVHLRKVSGKCKYVDIITHMEVSIQFSKEVYARKESIIVLRCELKIPSLLMPNSYPRDGIFNPHLTTIKDSYNLKPHFSRGTAQRRRGPSNGQTWSLVVFSFDSLP